MTGLIRLAAILGMVLHIASAHAAATANCDAANPAQVRLQISISGMRTTKGQIVVAIYPDIANEFLKSRFKLGEQRVPVLLPVTHVCFVVPSPGVYAVALFGDENDNGHFDLNALGVPVEGYGFSNNPHLYFGPPGVDKVHFTAHAGDNPIDVKMQYYP